MSVVAILGHTASGKSEIAEAIAERFGAQIISVDSMQVYRGMDIGTAKPSKDVRSRIPHHMVDVVDPAHDYTVTEFQTAARAVLDAAQPETRFLIAGGSGLHFRSIVDPLTFAPTDSGIRTELEAMDTEAVAMELLDLDRDAPSVVDMANPRRVIRALEVTRITGETPTARAATPEAEAVANYEPMIEHISVGVDAGDLASDRADTRFESMMRQGLLAEVEGLSDSLGRTASQAVGYRELLEVVRGTDNLDTAVDKAQASTRQLIKRQRTFFRRDPRIVWMPWQDGTAERVDSVARYVEKETSWTS